MAALARKPRLLPTLGPMRAELAWFGAGTESEMRGLMLFAAPFNQRKPHSHVMPGALSRLCREVLRERPWIATSVPSNPLCQRP